MRRSSSSMKRDIPVGSSMRRMSSSAQQGELESPLGASGRLRSMSLASRPSLRRSLPKNSSNASAEDTIVEEGEEEGSSSHSRAKRTVLEPGAPQGKDSTMLSKGSGTGNEAQKQSFKRSLSEDEDEEEAEKGEGQVQNQAGEISTEQVKIVRSLSDDEGEEEGEGGIQVAAVEPTQGVPLLEESSSMRYVDGNVRLVDEKPLDLWPPPLENKATWVMKGRDKEGGGVEQDKEFGVNEAPSLEHEWIEAWLDSMGMSLAFQESFGQLTLVEKRKKGHALRRLLTSTHLIDILDWLSAPNW